MSDLTDGMLDWVISIVSYGNGHTEYKATAIVKASENNDWGMDKKYTYNSRSIDDLRKQISEMTAE